ncbi:MAG: hypothetical protein IJF87_11155 [Erysipelotrichaceae bacterium]|nr:hypothetical protein [Erysipelotrichaceae bacterium]
MKQLKVKFLMGPPECNDPYIPTYSDIFLKELSEKVGIEVVTAEMDEVAKQPLPVYFIASGGAENGFKQNHVMTKEPYVLLTTPSYNSLAASMEIMGFLEENGLKGEILHGDMDTLAHELKLKLQIAEANDLLSKSHLGCFGEPGGLIASDVDFNKLEELTGCRSTLYTLDELIDEYHKGGYEDNDYTRQLKEKSFNLEETEKALNVYGALKRLIKKYGLTAVTVRCFDLLERIKTTGCLALALLNAEGIPAACEGDQKSLLSMVIMRLLTNRTGFMANPCSMDPTSGEIIFAHCTIPIDMPDDYYLTTHFESGIGVAVASDIKPQVMTVFKCNGDLTRHYAGRAQLVETMHRKDLCRTQMKLKMEDGTQYFSKKPISNHHIICKGDYKELIDAFFAQYE